MSYVLLSPEEQLRMIDEQLLAVEKEHYRLSQLTGVDPTGVSIGTNPGPARIAWLESEMERLLVLKDELLPAATPTS